MSALPAEATTTTSRATRSLTAARRLGSSVPTDSEMLTTPMFSVRATATSWRIPAVRPAELTPFCPCEKSGVSVSSTRMSITRAPGATPSRPATRPATIVPWPDRIGPETSGIRSGGPVLIGSPGWMPESTTATVTPVPSVISWASGTCMRAIGALVRTLVSASDSDSGSVVTLHSSPSTACAGAVAPRPSVPSASAVARPVRAHRPVLAPMPVTPRSPRSRVRPPAPAARR